MVYGLDQHVFHGRFIGYYNMVWMFFGLIGRSSTNTEKGATANGILQKIASDATWTKEKDAVKIPLKCPWY